MSDSENVKRTKETKLNRKEWIRKDGTIVVKEYDQKQYNITSYLKNKDKMNELILCQCGKSYKQSNAYNHNKTQKHKLNLQINTQLSQLNQLKI